MEDYGLPRSVLEAYEDARNTDAWTKYGGDYYEIRG